MTTRAERFYQKEVYSEKQRKIAKNLHVDKEKLNRKYLSTSACTCGDSTCFLCGNPRKFMGELTIQERRMFQEAIYDNF